MLGGSDLPVETAAQPASTTTALSLCPLPAGRGRGRTLPAWMQPRTLDTTPVPGGLQQQVATGAGPGTDSFGQREAGVSISAVPAMAPLSVGGEQASEVQQEGGEALAADGRCLVEVTPPVERARRTSPPTTASVGTTTQGVAPGGPQQPSSRGPMTTSRAASSARPSPQLALHPRYHLPSPAALGLAIVPRPVRRGR